VPHKLREIDVSMVKVVSTARRAVAVRCIGCGTNSIGYVQKAEKIGKVMTRRAVNNHRKQDP